MSQEEERPKCRNCFYWQYDMDGVSCAHPAAMALSPFGLSLNGARSKQPESGVCGPEGRLYKQTKTRPLV